MWRETVGYCEKAGVAQLSDLDFPPKLKTCVAVGTGGR